MPRGIKNLFLFSDNKKISLFYVSGKIVKNAESSDGVVFKKSGAKKITLEKDKFEKGKNFRVFKLGKERLLSYERGGKICGALSSNFFKWLSFGQMSGLKSAGAIVPDFFYDDDRVMYTGDKNGVKTAYSPDLKKWRFEKKTEVLKLLKGRFDSRAIDPAAAFIFDEGIVVLSYCLDKDKNFSIGAALFDKDNPEKLIWRSDEPIWMMVKKEKIIPLALINFKDTLLFYYEDKNGDILCASLPPFGFWRMKLPAKSRLKIKKEEKNPILGPRQGNKWESNGAFNPTVFMHEGKFYILYRALGDDNISVVGMATSKDGITIDERLETPIYVPREHFEGGKLTFNENEVPVFGSGGGWGGCEDPRVVKINDRIYLVYAAFDGCSEVNIALSSISIKNFLAKKWSAWTKPVLITNESVKTKNPAAIKQCLADRPGAKTTGEKDPAILPEKINGKYVIFHRLWPNIVFDYVDSLNFDGKKFLRGANIIPVRPGMWDSQKISIGCSPLKIKEGWLVIYNGVDKKDSSKYKIGAMILDAKNPAKVLYRCNQPILEPEEHYENHGHKFGIAFVGGAAIKDGKLFVYYGGSDTYSCVATADLNDFVKKLIKNESPKLKKVKIV